MFYLILKTEALMHMFVMVLLQNWHRQRCVQQLRHTESQLFVYVPCMFTLGVVYDSSNSQVELGDASVHVSAVVL